MIYTFVKGIFLASRFIFFWFAFGYILPLLENFLPRCPKVYADLWSRPWSVCFGALYLPSSMGRAQVYIDIFLSSLRVRILMKQFLCHRDDHAIYVFYDILDLGFRKILGYLCIW
jgi:hypothetical protein